jgi:O-antigen/teichoic acid export membrane protein
MSEAKSNHIARAANAALRMVALTAKLCLTLYIGRYLSLADMGVYGLVAGTAVIMTAFLGIRLDYVVSRELVSADPAAALIKMRDQAVFYALNYIVLAAAMIALAALDVTGISSKIMFVIFVLSVVESCANMTFLNITSMGRPLLANMLFFIRSGLWVLPAIALGLLAPAFRTTDTIFVLWALGVTSSLIVTLWIWRSMPWGKALRVPVDWKWIKKSVVRCSLIWLSSVGATMGFYVDRFVVAHNLGLDLAGVATFYSSFTTALYALVQSGVLAFAYPRLIRLHQKRDEAGFWQESRHVGWHVAVFAGGLATAVGVAVPLLGRFLHRQVLVDQAPTLWLMLFGMWIVCNASTLYNILFSRHQDRPVWLGDLLYLIPAFGCNAVLVPLVGIRGIGYSAIISALWLLLWRAWHVRYGSRPG